MSETIAIVIPTYNEAENIEELIREILAQEGARPPGAGSFRVIVVDDNSPDGTSEKVMAMQQVDERLDLVRRAGKLGLGTAYLAGLARARELGAAFAVTMDADFSHNPEHLPALLEAAAGADVALGSRYVPGGGVRNWPIHRQWLSSVANFLARLVLRFDIRDCTSGYRCYRLACLDTIALEEITSNGYSFLIDLICRLHRAGARIVESPIIFTDRRGGQSKIGKSEILKAIKTLWVLR